MLTRYLGPVLLLAALFFGDQIRIHRPDHKFRLTVEVETADGVNSVSGVFAVHPFRGYTQGGTTTTKGDAMALDIAGKPLIVLLAHDDDGFDLDDFNYVAVRAFAAAGQRAAFKMMDRVSGAVPVTSKLVPLMATFANAADSSTMRAVNPADLAATFGANVRLRGVSVSIVPNGLWPLDFGGALGEPVTRGITKVLPWAASTDAAAIALKAAGWTLKPDQNAREAFTR